MSRVHGDHRAYRERLAALRGDSLACPLCGQLLAMAGTHFRTRHGIRAPVLVPRERAIRRDVYADRELPVWTAARVLGAFRAYARRHDGAPPPKDHAAGRGRAPGFDGRDRLRYLPGNKTVQRLFGSWGAAVLAAGLEPRRRGRPRKGASSQSE